MAKSSSPMMDQYRRIRRELPEDTILFFRLGDFYEMFFEDAKAAAPILDIALTKRNKVPMCGVPYHAADGYLAKLIKAGKKVAVCDQTEDASAAKGIVKREVIRVVTPGTILEDDQVLDAKRSNYLAGLCLNGERFGLAMLELSTGEFFLEEVSGIESIRDNLLRYDPSECIVPEEQEKNKLVEKALAFTGVHTLSPYDDWTFESDSATELLTRHFQVHSLEGFGCEASTVGLGAAGAVLHYVVHALKRQVGHIRRLVVKQAEDYMLVDETTVAHLELEQGTRPASRGRGSDTSLLKVLDATKTPMGGRLMRDWLLRPLSRLDDIRSRHDTVEALFKERALLFDVQESLGGVRDLERTIARLGTGSGNARDVLAIIRSLQTLPSVKQRISEHPVSLLAGCGQDIALLPDLVEKIETALVDEPPITIKEGRIIREGYHAELDELRSAAKEGKQWLADFQTREQDQTGIKSLKVRHNKVFGYYIEVTKSYLDRVPEEYVRKQTLVNAERFITPELKEYESKILGAQDRSMDLEYELFLAIRSTVVEQTEAIQRTAAAVARLDVLVALADRALNYNYVRPEMDETGPIHIEQGRHPVVERVSNKEPFVANDTLLDGLENQIMMITGPNMAGKSTYIRQVALIVIMAQMGSFVPASKAVMGLVDRVFTRVGASDDLARGRSTFMVEMQETANILNNATPRSLIVLDEIGRGTSTFDGISIAWAVAEYLHNQANAKAKTLFATHYHELTDLALTLPGVKNYNVLVREKNDRIVFLRRIAPGATDKSYGIQVARLAGLPGEVIGRAKEILKNLEESELGESGQPRLAEPRSRKKKDPEDQLQFLGELDNE